MSKILRSPIAAGAWAKSGLRRGLRTAPARFIRCVSPVDDLHAEHRPAGLEVFARFDLHDLVARLAEPGVGDAAAGVDERTVRFVVQ